MVVDFIIIAIVLLSTFLAYRKGFVKLAIQLCTFIIAIAVTVVLYQPISNFVINKTGIDESIEDAIYEKANDVMQGATNGDEIAHEITTVATEGMLPQTARTLAVNIVTGGVAVILFIAIKIVLRFVSILADLVTKLPIIEQVNKAGGIVYGLLRGVLIIYVLLLILTIPKQVNPGNTINQKIEHSYLGKTMYENNILNIFFK